MAELDIHIRITPRVARWAMAAACLCLMVMVVSPEDITLDTYYPAPTGVYTNMITTQQTILARDSGNVGIGTTNAGTAKLEVHGPGTGALDLWVSGKIETGGDGSGTGEIYLNNNLANGPAIGQTGNNLGLTNGGGWNFQMDQNGDVGIGIAPTANAELAVGGNVGIGNSNPKEQLDVTGTIRATPSPGCSLIHYTPGGLTKICPGYVTLVAGIYSPEIETNAADGWALCCP